MNTPERELAALGTRIADGQAAERERTLLMVTLAKSGWTQKRIAEAAGITQQAVSLTLSRADVEQIIRAGIAKDRAEGRDPRESLDRYAAALDQMPPSLERDARRAFVMLFENQLASAEA